jgi:hypothetical protein
MELYTDFFVGVRNPVHTKVLFASLNCNYKSSVRAPFQLIELRLENAHCHHRSKIMPETSGKKGTIPIGLMVPEIRQRWELYTVLQCFSAA